MATTGSTVEKAPTLEDRVGTLRDFIEAGHGYVDNIIGVAAEESKQPGVPGLDAILERCTDAARDLRDRLDGLATRIGRL